MNTPIKPPCTNIGPNGTLRTPSGIELRPASQQLSYMDPYHRQASMFQPNKPEIKMPDYGDKDESSSEEKEREIMNKKRERLAAEGHVATPVNSDCHVMILIIPELRSDSFVKIAKSSSRAAANLEFNKLGLELNKKARMGMLPNATFLMFSTNEKTARFLTHYSGLFETYSTAESLLCSFSKNIRDIAVFPLATI